MNINLETANQHAVQAYSPTQIKINSVIYEQNFIVCHEAIQANWIIHRIQDLNENTLAALISYQPEIIIIGHSLIGQFPPASILHELNLQRIGLESMSIGAACRTYNVLLSENRRVVLGIIF